MVKDIKDMTLGEITETLINFQLKAIKAEYINWDKKNALLDKLSDLMAAAYELEKNQRYITDENYINDHIEFLKH